MIEIPARNEIIIEKKIDVKLLDRESNSKTFRGYLNGCLAKARHDNNRELEVLFEELLRKFNEFYPDSITKYTVLDIEQWQGKNSYELYRGFDNNFYITEYRKDKFTGEINKSEPIKVEKEHINYMLYLVSRLELDINYKARYFWEKLIPHYKLSEEGIDTYNFNGGGNHRSTYYFPLYLYPARVLEQLKLIKLMNGQGGGIIRIK